MKRGKGRAGRVGACAARLAGGASASEGRVSRAWSGRWALCTLPRSLRQESFHDGTIFATEPFQGDYGAGLCPLNSVLRYIKARFLPKTSGHTPYFHRCVRS